MLRRGVFYNALGWVLPAALAVASVPALTRTLGPERFGLLALGWAAVSAFSVLDLGIGRATSFLVADRTARGARSEIPALVAAAGWGVWMLFAPIALVGIAAAPWLVERVFDIPVALHDEATTVVRLLAAALPVVVHGIMVRSAFEGEQRFGIVNAFRIPLGVVTWGGPWVASLWTSDVRVLVGVMVGARTLYWLGQTVVLARLHPEVTHKAAAPFRALIRAGGWMAVSGVVSPILAMADRALILMFVPIATVGWYVAAGEGAMKLGLVAAALQPVLFPALTAATAAAIVGPRLVGDLMRRATLWTGGALALPAIALVLFAQPLMQWWLGTSAAPEAALVFRLFVIATCLNSLAQVAYSALQAGGEARRAAILHLVELPLYLVFLAFAAMRWGALGAGLAWSVRMTLDTVLMWALAIKYVPGARFAFGARSLEREPRG